MSHFSDRLRAARRGSASRTFWFYVPYDQLTLDLGPWSRLDPSEVGLVLAESANKAARRPYHRMKLYLLLANQRQFAVEAAERGFAVDYRRGDAGFADQLAEVVATRGPLTAMRPAERELRAELSGLVDRGALRFVPHEGWLTGPADLGDGPPWRMDAFYRRVRQRTGILMERGKPVGGRYSFDGENRDPWRGQPPAPAPPTFPLDAVDAEVAALIEARYAHHPGALHPERVPTTLAQVEQAWAWARSACLPQFGPFEDAMSRKSRGLFHTRIAGLLNLHRLTPRRVIDDALALDLGLASKEGFIRQILGWREFVARVHEATDGFRTLAEVAATPGDGGWGAWKGASWPVPALPPGVDGGATPNVLAASRPVPPWFWGERSGLACLDTVVSELWDEGWTHHIPRLMVLSNLATLLDVEPRALTDWFWAAYLDAYDWVVEPNVLGMGTFGVGDALTTKPYVSGSAYLAKMGDYCATCQFDPKKDCPIASWYWAFLDHNRERLKDNPRMKLALASAGKRSAEARAHDADVARRWGARRLRPDERP